MDKIFWLKIGLNFFELIAFIAGLANWKKVKQVYWKWFVVYCGIIFLTEVVAKYVGYVLKNPKLNGDIYFFFGVPVQFLFLFWLFYMWFNNRKIQAWILIALVAYAAAWITELLIFKERRMWFSSFSYSVGNIFLLVFIILFFLRLMISNEILEYRHSMMFWVSIGLLVFYLGTLPFYALRNTLYYNYKQIFYPYWDITYILGCIMYLFFALAFIWGKPK